MAVSPQRSFSHLSIRDLIEARDMFHAHLVNKRNVVATAVGRYLIRKQDLGPNEPKNREKRTLSNSRVVDISWPCILVFVARWQEDQELLQDGANEILPKCVYMPDGRVVPICVVEAPRQEIDKTLDVDIDQLRFPDNKIGGGYPLIIHSQGVDRVATVGCVVSDGHDYYALTNKHVAGTEGEMVYSRFGHERQRIGVTSGLSLGPTPFDRLYPEWNLRDTLVNCDVGLVSIDDVTRWKTDIFQLGPFDEVYDLNTLNLDLRLIAEHSQKNGEWTTDSGRVVAFGAVSGRMEGEIAGLFYRYKSVGGTEYISDFLVAGRNGAELRTHHGDSGAVWLLEGEPRAEGGRPTLRPIALQWGQHVFFADGEARRSRFSYGLGTSLSNMCRELNVDLVRGWNVDVPYTWGKVGHYTVAARAIDMLQEPKLRSFINANLENITFANDKINAGLDTKDNPDLPRDPDLGICPLADVPDIIWKQSKKADYGRLGDENPNHYADADAITTAGKTLFDLCDSKEKLTVDVWSTFYDNIDKERLHLPQDKPVSRGLICFRVWQIYDYMVKAAQGGRADQFIFAAGVLAHYVGDACQPLHSSYLSNGDPADDQTIQYTAKRTSSKHTKGDVYPKTTNPGNGVHTAYEDAMIDARIDTIWPALPASGVNAEAIPPIDSGQAAGFATLALMKKTQETIPPKEIVEAFKEANGNRDVSAALAERFEDRTVECLARGSNYLAAIWTAAWQEGQGGQNVPNLGLVTPEKLIKLYRDRSELPSMHLDTIQPELETLQPVGR